MFEIGETYSKKGVKAFMFVVATIEETKKQTELFVFWVEPDGTFSEASETTVPKADYKNWEKVEF